MRTEAVVAELETDLERTKAALSRVREKTSKVADATAGTVATIGGGAVGGYLAANYADKTFLGLPPQTMLGAAATLVGVFGYAGKNSEIVAAFGEGTLAFDVGFRVFNNAQKKKQQQGQAAPVLPGAKVSGEVGAMAALPQGNGPITLEQLQAQFRAMQGR